MDTRHVRNQTTAEPRVQSENPDFKELVRATNLGARLNNAKQNWERLPVTLNTAIDRVTSSIKPPAPTDSLRQKLARAADTFKNAIRHAVSEHLVAQYSSNQRSLAHLDGTDRDQAYQIARKQLIRSNGRINGTRADELLSITKADEESHRQEVEWRTVQGRKRPASRTPPPEVEPEVPVATSNRFAGLTDELDLEGLQELLDRSISDPNTTAAAKEPPTKSTRGTSPMVEIPRRVTTVAEVHHPFRTPQTPGPPPTSANPPGATTPREDSSTNTEVMEVHPAPTTPLPSPASLQRQSKNRLTVFPPQSKETWSLPEINDDEDVLLMTDSNGVTLADTTPPNWRVAAYRGGRFHDVIRILHKYKIADHIRHLVIMVGVNDRSDTSQTLVNTLTRLKEVISLQRRAVTIAAVPYFARDTPPFTSATSRINGYLSDLFGETNWLWTYPTLLKVTGRTPEDISHYSRSSAYDMVRQLEMSMSSLN